MAVPVTEEPSGSPAQPEPGEKERSQRVTNRLVTGELLDVDVRSRSLTTRKGMSVELASVHASPERELAISALQELETRDPLTGLLNREQFTILAERELERARRYRRPLGLVALLMDGDVALESAAAATREVLRTPDLAARVDTGLVVILLPETGPGEAELLAASLRDGLRRAFPAGAALPQPALLDLANVETVEQLLSRAVSAARASGA